MNTLRNRRDFLCAVGQGMLVAGVGSGVALDMGLVSSARAAQVPESLTFGPLEPLVELLQETPINRLLPVLVRELNHGTELKTLVSAAALANARTFGGEDYIGFHTLMAIGPAYYMSRELPADRQAMPVFKVLYRNTNRIHEHGGRDSEVLHPVEPAKGVITGNGGEALRAAVRAQDLDRAERLFARLAADNAEEAFNDVLYPVQDSTDVHRVVLPYRAWDLVGIIGREHAHTLLRQSVRFCVQKEAYKNRGTMDEPRTVLPTVFDQFHLADKKPGTREADDAWVEQLSKTFFNSTPTQAAEAAGQALADGFAPAAVGEAISLAANQLLLRDSGRTARDELPNKPIGSVHGDSIGVHASDSANAWRNLARAGNPRNVFASLILGAYQVAYDRVNRGGDFLHWNPLPVERQVRDVKITDQKGLLAALDEAVRGNLQARACALVHLYGKQGYSERAVFDLLLGYAISEDGSLHGEKYYRTVSEEFAATRPAFRWRHLLGLARVTASEYGRRAPGYDEARGLLKIS